MSNSNVEEDTELSAERTTTFPNDAVRELADRLMDHDYNLPGDEAVEMARDIVIDVTLAVDRLRAQEASADPEHPLLKEDVELIARSLNDDWAAGSQGARWDSLDESERAHWRAMARFHMERGR